MPYFISKYTVFSSLENNYIPTLEFISYDYSHWGSLQNWTKREERGKKAKRERNLDEIGSRRMYGINRDYHLKGEQEKKRIQYLEFQVRQKRCWIRRTDRLSPGSMAAVGCRGAGRLTECHVWQPHEGQNVCKARGYHRGRPCVDRFIRIWWSFREEVIWSGCWLSWWEQSQGLAWGSGWCVFSLRSQNMNSSKQ